MRGYVPSVKCDQPEKAIAPMDEVMGRVQEEIGRLHAEIASAVAEVAFET
jgi:hypothetical protein